MYLENIKSKNKIEDKLNLKCKKTKSNFKATIAKRQALRDIFGSSSDSDEYENDKKRIKLNKKKSKLVENSKKKLTEKNEVINSRF